MQPSKQVSISRASPLESNTMKLVPLSRLKPSPADMVMKLFTSTLPVSSAPNSGSPEASLFSPWAKLVGGFCGCGGGRSDFLSVICGFTSGEVTR